MHKLVALYKSSIIIRGTVGVLRSPPIAGKPVKWYKRPFTFSVQLPPILAQATSWSRRVALIGFHCTVLTVASGVGMHMCPQSRGRDSGQHCKTIEQASITGNTYLFQVLQKPTARAWQIPSQIPSHWFKPNQHQGVFHTDSPGGQASSTAPPAK